MKISCCWLYAIDKYGYPPSINNSCRAFKEMAGLGFKYVELEGIRKKNMEEVAKNKEKFKRLCSDLGVEIVNFCPILPSTVSLDKVTRQQGIELFDLGVELANYFGCRTIQLDSFTPPLEFIGEVPYKEALKYGREFKIRVDPDFKWEEQWNAIVDSVSRCNEKAKRAGLNLTMEPRVGEIISNTDALLRLMDAVSDDNFGAVLDTGHLHAQKEILPLSIEKLGNRIKYVHVSDNDGRDNEHLSLGEGTIDWEGVFLALKKHKFAGYVAVDIGEVENIDKAYKDSKKFLEEIEKKIL